jgi:hypothetical protein
VDLPSGLMILNLVASVNLTPPRGLPPQAAEALAAVRCVMAQATLAIVAARAVKDGFANISQMSFSPCGNTGMRPGRGSPLFLARCPCGNSDKLEEPRKSRTEY